MDRAFKKHGPAVVDYYAGGSGAGPEQGVVNLVLLASEADEAGEAKAAKAFMDIASAFYRSGLRGPDQAVGLNEAIATPVGAEYLGVPGLQLYPPEGTAGWCFQPDDTCAWLIGRDTMWECERAGPGFDVKRITWEEAEEVGCPFE